MRFAKTLRVQVQAIVDLHLAEECLYYGATAGITVELLQNIEDLFNEFLRETGARMADYKFQRWTRFFKERARYRTLCVECAEMIQDYHHKLRRKHRRQAQANGEDPTKWSPRGDLRVTGSRQPGLGASHARSLLLSSPSPIQRPATGSLRAPGSAAQTPSASHPTAGEQSPQVDARRPPSERPEEQASLGGPLQPTGRPHGLTHAQVRERLGPRHRRLVAAWVLQARKRIQLRPSESAIARKKKREAGNR